MNDERTKEVEESGHPTEAQMREADAPWPKTREELMSAISELIDRPHDYGTAVYAISMAAVATFNYAASTLGATGFQASCADMDFISRTRRIKGPFGIVNGKDMLYPQYNIPRKVSEWMEEWGDWAAKEAAKLLSENKDGHAHEDVVAHWKRLAAYAKPEAPDETK